jgi:hypothetical protein
VAPTDRESALDELYAAPLADFVAERKRLARELREGGDRPGAAEIAKWPKPSPAAWALNAVARDDADLLGDWLAAAGSLREASAAPGGGDALRTAMAAHRTATAGLLEAAGARAGLSEAMLDRVRALLQAATADPALAEALEAGRVDEPRGGEAEPAAAPPRSVEEPARPAAPAKTGDRRRAQAARREQEERAREEERRAELERQLAAATEALDEHREKAAAAHASSAAAEERVAEAERTLRRSESEAAAARAAAREADRAAAEAERAVDALRSRSGV